MGIRKNKSHFAMDVAASAEEFQDEKGSSLKKLVDELETGQAENTLSKTENRVHDSEGGEDVGRVEEKLKKSKRPTSADVQCLLEKWPRGSEGGCLWRRAECFSSRCGSSASEGEPGGPWASLAWLRGCPPRSRSVAHCCAHSDAFPPGFPFLRQRRCKSSCDFSKTAFRNREKFTGPEGDFQKVRRSLRLLGFEPSDFGVSSAPAETSPKWKPKRRPATLSTKVTRRSISPESLRLAVRRAWLDDGLDESHRRLLAQAAYEEWYFVKERELREKRKEERIKQLNMKVKLGDDFQRKKEKSEEEFQKWLTRKRMKRKGHGAVLLQKQEKDHHTLTVTKEKSEKAFLNWKKTKDIEMEKRKKEKREEEEKKIEKEKQKAERKITAEKAFQQWKKKLEENERKRDAKKQKNKRKQEMEERQRRAEGSQISFRMWKEAKDEEKKRKMKQQRENDRTAREERCAQMEERMYEAEQAFEEWLERVDLRKEKLCYTINSYQKLTPWIPV